jgi:small subunit ribosomal protein S6
MRRYETIIIIDPDAREDTRLELIERVNEIISQHGGFLIELDDWGQRRMAYEIKKKLRGYYARVDYCGNGTLVDEIERTFRIDDRVMKYMTVLLDKEADVEAIKETIEMEKSKKEAENSASAEQQTVNSDQEANVQPDGDPA